MLLTIERCAEPSLRTTLSTFRGAPASASPIALVQGPHPVGAVLRLVDLEVVDLGAVRGHFDRVGGRAGRLRAIDSQT